MSKIIHRVSKKRGLPPGSLIYIGKERLEKVKITMTLIDYDSDNMEEKEIKDLGECIPYIDKPTTTWINIYGIHDTAVIEKAGEVFGIHPLVLEDILNTSQRPKTEDFEDYIYTIIKMIDTDLETDEIKTEQVSIVTLKNIVITFQERHGDVFNPVRKRIKDRKPRIRRQGSDYLTYALLDAIVDGYFLTFERLNDRIEDLETLLLEKPTKFILDEIYQLKRIIINLRKAIVPSRDTINNLVHEEFSLVSSETTPFLRDVYDHIVQIIETTDHIRDILNGMIDAYNSIMGNKMNEVMKVLTIIATLFIPLTFIAGIYGMNFTYMPELAWKWGYFAVLGIMAIATLLMLVYFKKKEWI
ncbi:magnesium/cobalt transporter CorA [bacterium]|nr:magnesium/cobalt transporter CorA [bacterium]